MKKALPYTIIIILTIIVLTCIFLMVFPYLNIKEIQVKGNENVTEEKVIEYVTENNFKNLFAFNIFKAEKKLLTNHYIKAVSFQKHFPSTLVVNITEYKVRGYISYLGEYLYIDDEGRVLDIQPSFTKQLPVVEGLKFNDFTLGQVLKVDNPSTFNSMVELSKLFSKYELLTDVVRVDLNNSAEIHLYVGKVDVIFGDLTSSSQKLLTLNEIVKQLDTNDPGILDLTVENPTFKYIT